MSNFINHDFWNYSILLYKNQDVKEACIFLQESFDLNINVLIFSCWHAENNKGVISKEELTHINKYIKSWHKNITQNFRHLRKSINKQIRKNPANSELEVLYQEALKHELSAENIEQTLILEGIHPSQSKRRSSEVKAKDALQNLQNYFAILKITLDDYGYYAIQALLNKAFPQLLANDLQQLAIPL